MAKLWEKTYSPDEVLVAFTVGIDYRLDLSLVRSDCMGSIAHARGLVKAGIISREDCAELERELRQIAVLAAEGKFPISRDDEDCHTAIENYLVERLGEAGKRIHTGRSRNDQVLTALRLYGKRESLKIRASLLGLIQRVMDFALRHREVPMPGRTHMQTAMPSSVGLWAGALAEQLSDDYRVLMAAWTLVDQSPLGSAASYGVPLGLDRDYTAGLMGFARAFNNVLYANNSRGKIEAVVLDALDQIGLSLSKYAQDLILFSLPEFGYFSLPDRLCTGSSIMPQKKNPDGLELLRSKSALISGWSSQVKSIIRSLPSGYNRDFQDTKEAFLRGLEVSLACVRIMDLSFEGLVVNADALEAAFKPDIFATDAAFALVEKGVPFRDAYRQIGTSLGELGSFDAREVNRKRAMPGLAGNLALGGLRDFLAEADARLKLDGEKFDAASGDLLGAEL